MKLKDKVLTGIANTAYREAVKDTQAICRVILHQPKLPQRLKAGRAAQ